MLGTRRPLRRCGRDGYAGGDDCAGEAGQDERAKDGAGLIRRELAAARRHTLSRAATPIPARRRAQGLYDPALDKDSCGVGFIADIKGRKSHQIVEDGLRILCNLEHRGAVGADPRMGDGAGILVQIPHKFFAKKAPKLGFTLPAPGEYAVGQLFMPTRRRTGGRSSATSTPR